MIDNNTTEEKYISQVVLPPIEEGDNERLYLIKDKNARDNIKTLQSNLTSLNEEVNTLDTKVDNIKIPDISNLVTTDNLNNKVSNLITRTELDNAYVKWSALTSNYSNNFVLNNSYAHTTNGIIDNATVDYTDVNDLYNNYAHTNANGTIDNANISYANINNLYNNYAHINNGEIDNATIDHSNINNLNTNYAHINNGTIDNANIDYANVNNLENNYAHIENGVIDNATINYSNINELENNYAHITNGKIDNATIDQAKVNNLSSNYAHITNGAIDNATINYAKIDELNSNYAHINNGIIDNASINYANINDLETNYAHITDGTIDNATISYANIDNLENNYAHINNGVIDNAKIDYGNVRFLDSHYAHISEGVIDNALIGYANVEQLDSHYAEIDMANVNNAWIENGIIKDGVIEDAKIAGVSANKITAGTIDAANVNVINLRADNLTVTKINGQPVIGGYTLIDSSISGYSEKNPSNEGWYELYDNAYHPTNDITVDSNKNYYTTSESVSLYDQNTIDSMFSNINERIDSQIETWTVDTVPLLNNEPAVNWTTDDEKDEHIGDICYVVNAASDYDGFTYRFTYDNTSHQYNWVLIQDNQVTAALGRITNLESFNNQLVHWEDATDEGVITVRGRITELSGRIDKTVKSSTQLWYTKADITTPAAPTSQVTDTSTNGGAWTTVVPVYNVNYPNYFYCWQYQYEDNTYGWSAIIYDQATTEAQERARTGVANAITAQETADSNIKSSIQLWFTKAQIKDENDNDLYPVKPNIQVTNNSATGVTSYNRWNLVVPIYNKNYPYYFYCYQQQKGNNSYQWTDVIYDEATSTAMAKAQSALPESTFTNFEQNTFKEVTDTIDKQAISITNLTTIIDNNGLTENTTITNTVNTISQKADTNESKISSLTTALGTNANGTSKENDIIHQVSDINQNLDSITTRVGKTEASLKGTYATSSTAANVQNKEATIFPAITNFELYKGAAITVKFINDNTISNPTLNINSSGAKPIKTYSGANLSEAEYAWRAGSTMTFIYDETNWCIQDSTELTRIKANETLINQTANNVLIKATSSDSTAAQGGQHIIESLINVAPEGIKISTDKVNIEGAAIFSGNGRLSQNSLNNAYDSKGSASAAQTAAINAAAQDATNKANAAQIAAETTAAADAQEKAAAAQAAAEATASADATSKANAAQQAAINAAAQDATNKVNAVNNQEQLIYIQAISGTLSIPDNVKPTTWVNNTGESVPSDETGLTPEWTTKRPTYRSNYPILFVAIQRQTVGGTITCSTPLKDDTLTVIDGGHITTGAIDASRITTGTLDASSITVSNLTADNIIADRINGEPVTQATLNGNIQNNINTISDATTSALNNLATIENVVDTLTWVTEHGTMTSTTDTAIDVTKVYFILDNNGDYIVGNNKYSIVQEPNVANLSNYYELTIDKSVQNYIATHLSLTHEGLWLTPMATESNGYKVLVATGSGNNYPIAGTYIIDNSGMIIAQFTSTGIAFAEDKEFTIGDDNAFIHFDGNGHINIGGSQVTIGGNTTLQQLLNKYNSTITSNDISVSKSGNIATITIGNDSVNIVDGAAGEDGAQILGITTAPSSYTTTINGFTPTYRIALSTVKTQSGASEVKIGDILAYSYYHYPVGYVDASYIYCGVRKSIRGETGAAGHSPVITTSKNNDGSVTINVDGTPMNTVDAGEDGDTPVITTTKGNDGSVAIYIDGVLSNTVEAGANGTSYYTYIRYSANANGSNMVTTPTNATKYIGIYTGTSSSVPSYTEFEWSKYIGENGNDADPLTIISTAVDYQLSTSGTTEPTGTWSETPLAPTTTQYLWTRTTLTFSDNTTITSYSVGGKTGQDGAIGGRWYAGTNITGTSTTATAFSSSGITAAVIGDMYFNTSTYNTYRCTVAGNASTAKWVYTANIKGQAGTNGVSITGVEHQYYLSTSSTSQANGSWTVKPATYVKGRYYWERWKISFSNGDPTYTTATLAEEVTSAWAAIEQNDEAITLKANSSDVYTKTVVDNKITQEVTDRNAAINTKADEITSTVSETYTTKEEFDNLEIGGKNLVWDTAWNDVANRWSVWNSPTTREIVEIDGKRWLHLVTTTTKFEGYQQNPSKRNGYGEIKAGDNLTVSFIAYATTAATTACIGIHWLNNSGNIVSQSWITTNLTTTPQRFTWTYELDADSSVVGFNIMVGDNSDVARELWISEVKLEKGNKATDWTPAPEDIETRVSSAESAITQNAHDIELKVSETDVTGNYLVSKINLDSTTATIDADRIEINGTAVFNAISSDVDDAITSKGYQTSSQVNNAITSKGYATTTQAQGYADAVQDNLNASRAWYAECSTAAATVAKVATITPATTDFALTNGVVVNVKFSVTNTGAVESLTLNVNETGAKSIKTQRSNSLTNLGHAGVLYQNAVIPFVYNGQYWLAIENYNSDTYNRTRMQNVITAATAITASHIVCGTSAGYKNIAAGVQFDLSYPLLYAASAIATAGTGDNNYLQINSINAANNGTIETGTNYSTLYLKGTVTGNIFTIAESPFLTTVQPTTENGFFYIPLGVFYNSTTGIYFNSSKDLYAYLDGQFRQVTPTEIMASQRIYYRSKVSGTVPKPTAWVTLATNKYNDTVSVGNDGWSTKVTPIAASKAENVAKYLYLYTCEQRKRLDGTVKCTDVILDENTTIIDGGNIITHTVTAEQLNATSINASKSLTVGAMTDAAASTILNSNISVGGRNLLKYSAASSDNLQVVGGNNATFVSEDGYDCYKATGGSTVGYFYGSQPSASTVRPYLEANMTYIYSAWIKVETTASGVTSVSHHFTSLGHHQVYNANSTASDKSHEDIVAKRVYTPSTVNIGEWTYITEQFTTNSLDGSIFGKYVKHALGSDYTVYVRDMKLEKGNTATDWTPAPEDVDTAVSDAAKTATSYVTDIDSNGITVHPSRSDYATNGGRAVINGDGLTIYLGSDDVASYGASARIGKVNSDRVTVDSTNGITIYKGNNKKLQTTVNGIDIYGDDSITNIASFGETTRIGRSSQGHAQISENGFDYFQGNENVFTVEAYGEQVYELGTEYGDRVTIPAGENARVSGTYDSQIVLEEPKCVYQLETGLWKEINYSSDSEESIYYNGINSSTTTDSSIETWGFNVYNNTSSSITAVIAQVFDRRPVSTRIGKNNSDRVTVDPTNGITIYKGNNKKLQTTANGINIYQDNNTSIASFGSTTRIGADNNAQVIIESDSFEIKNQLGNRFFNIEGRSSNQTIDRSPIEVCEWSDKDNVNEDSVTITDSNIIASTASNFTAPTFNIIVNEEEFNLDSSQVEFIISTNQININLTSTGVTFVQDKMINTYDDEEGNTIVGPDFLCTFYVTYSRTVADKAIFDFTGNQIIRGNSDLLTLSNNISNNTSTLMKVVNTKTNKAIKFGIGSNGVTRGVWDETAKNWIICHDTNNKVVIQGPNFGVASTGDVKANAITMTGALTTPILKTKNPSKNGKYRTSESIYTLTPFTSYDKDGAQIGYSNIVASTNRIYRSFAVTNLKTNKTAALYVNNYDSGAMSLTYSSGMTLHATSVDPLSCITAAISGQTSKNLTDSYANLTLAAVTTVGSDLTISGGGIKCARAGKVMLSASAYFDGFSAANVCNLRILIGTTVAAWVNNRAVSDRCQLTIPSRITTVAAGDVLYMAVCNSSTAAGSVDGSRTQTWLTVQYLT